MKDMELNFPIKSLSIFRYAWEIPFQKVVAEARRLEIKQIRYASYIRGVNLSSFVFIESKFNLIFVKKKSTKIYFCAL